MTVEAEVLGSLVDMGSLSCEPKIEKEAYPSVDAVPLADVLECLESGRVSTVIGAIGRVSKTHPSIPVTGVVTGPLSAAASVVDPVTLFKELRKNRDRAHQVIDYISDLIAAFAVRMVEAGATVITVADPGAPSGEILGPALFEEYTVRYLNKIADCVHAAGSPVIVHICGDLKGARRHLGSLKADALSVDSVMNLARIKEESPYHHHGQREHPTAQRRSGGQDRPHRGQAGPSRRPYHRPGLRPRYRHSPEVDPCPYRHGSGSLLHDGANPLPSLKKRWSTWSREPPDLEAPGAPRCSLNRRATGLERAGSAP